MRHAAFFDLDGTLLRGESQFAFLLWCLRSGIAPRLRALPVLVQYASYLSGVSRDAFKLRQSGFGLLRGISVEQLENAASEFFQANLAAGFRRQALPLVEAHRAQGHLIVLLTSACDPIANLVAANLRADALIATRLLVSKDAFTGERELPEPYSDGKRTLVERFCQERKLLAQDCFAYTDHHSDASLLEFVGHPVAANPTTKLQAIAAARGWPQINLDADELPQFRLQREGG